MKAARPPFTLNGKVAIVTGAAQGIGRAIAAAFVAADAQHVVCADIHQENLAQIEQTARLSTALLDVCDEAGWRRVVAETLDTQGRIDVLVNNAGVLAYGTIADIDPSELRRVLEVNVMGVLLGMQAVIPHMKAEGRGAIINTSSASAMRPSNFLGAYVASKFAVRGLSRSAAMELGLHGIRVNSVHPGGVNTPMSNPLGQSDEEVNKGYGFAALQRAATPEEIAYGVTYLASDAASYCSGTELVIDGGMANGLYFQGLPGSPENP